MSAEKPSVRVSLDLTGCEDYLKQAAVKQDMWSVWDKIMPQRPEWVKMMSQHEPQGQKSEGMIVRRLSNIAEA